MSARKGVRWAGLVLFVIPGLLVSTTVGLILAGKERA